MISDEKISQPSDFDKYDEPRLHMERLMAVRLMELDFPTFIAEPLYREGIKTLGALTTKTRKQLLDIPMIGIRSVSRIEILLARAGLYLKG